jgi:hypothetical protein
MLEFNTKITHQYSEICGCRSVLLGEQFPTLRNVVIPYTIPPSVVKYEYLHIVTDNTNLQQHRCPNLKFRTITSPPPNTALRYLFVGAVRQYLF